MTIISSRPRREAAPTKLWRRPLFWGIAISVVLGVVPLFLGGGGEPVLLGIIVTLLGTVVSLLVDPLLRFDDLTSKVSETLARVTKAVILLDAPPSLQLFVSRTRDDWKRIEEVGGLSFALLQAHTRDAVARVHSIALGRVAVRASDPNNFRSAPLDMFRQFQMVHAVNPTYWNQLDGQEYLARQRDAIRAGTLRVERLMVMGRDEIALADVKRAVMSQILVGIAVRIVDRETIPRILRRYDVDFGIVTDTRAAKFLAMPMGDELESFWYDTNEVADYEQGFHALRVYSRDVSEVYPDIEEFQRRTPPPQQGFADGTSSAAAAP